MICWLLLQLVQTIDMALTAAILVLLVKQTNVMTSFRSAWMVVTVIHTDHFAIMVRSTISQ